ncbi:MAG: N-acetylmuramoyl-L-alanine amidase [Acidimicrobiales bacterium]
MLAATFLALLGALVLAPAPSFAVEAASRLDREPLTLTASPATVASGATATGATALGLEAAAPDRLHASAAGVADFRLIAVRLHTASDAPVLLRVHDATGWGDWQSLATDGDDSPDADSPEAAHAAEVAGGATFSEPAWVGHADGYEISVPADATDATAEVVRDTTRIVKKDGSQAGAVVVPASGQPAINSRASWGARPSVDPPSIAPTVRMAIVHHSVTANDYAPGDVPGILRSIQTFHIDGRGWNDIAYNFAVDKYGTIWEARGGGITNAVLGGHAMGANYETTGVVTLGDFTAAAAPQAMVNSVADLVGWKLYVHGTDPNGTNTYTLGQNTKYPTGTVLTLPNVIGHRDVGSTGCPGDNLYPRLGEIRTRAGSVWNQQRSTPGFWPGVVIGSNADGRLQAFVIGNDQQIRTQWQLANGRWSGWLTLGGQVAGKLTVAQNADGRLQVFGIGIDGTLRTTWQLTRNGTWSGIASMGGHWSATAGVGIGLDRDGRMEAFVLGHNDEIWNAWQKAPNGTWDGYASIGGSFPSFASITTGLNKDGRIEVFAIGDGPTIVHNWQKATGGWGGFSAIGGAATGDLAVANDADGRLEVVGIGADGTLWDAWQLAPNGGWSAPAVLARGLKPDGASVLANDTDGRLEFFGLSPGGSLLNIWQKRPNGTWDGPASMGGSWIGSPAVRAGIGNRLTALAFAGPDATTLAVNAQATAGGVFSGWSNLP